jgi:hypothetical protein
MAVEIRTPFSVSAVELSGGGLFRKQVLAFKTINYTDRTGKKRKLTFDRKYGEDLVRAFKDGAYPQVPFQLADADNRHTNAPDRTGGEVVALELSKDGTGVDAYLRTWGAGTTVVEQNPKLGVSARIIEDLSTPEGRTFPRVIQHVLGTVDPQIRDMRPWEKVNSVDLSSGTVSEVLDLSAATYERSAGMPGSTTDDGKTTLELSTAQATRLRKLLDDDEALEALAEELGEDFFDNLDDEPGEEDETSEDSEDDGPEGDSDDDDTIGLSRVGSEALELANANIDSLNSRVIELTAQLSHRQTEAEIAELRRRDLAPAVIEAARPLLGVESGAIELSNGPGTAVDPGQVIREVLDTVIELASSGHLLVDPDSEEGNLQGRDAKTGKREALLKDWESYD